MDQERVQLWLDTTWPGDDIRDNPRERFRQALERMIHVSTCRSRVHLMPYNTWPCRVPLAQSDALREVARA